MSYKRIENTTQVEITKEVNQTFDVVSLKEQIVRAKEKIGRLQKMIDSEQHVVDDVTAQIATIYKDIPALKAELENDVEA